MSDDRVTCPKCGSDDLSFHQKKDEWHCQACQHRFSASDELDAFPSVAPEKLRLFLSYGHDDNEELVRRIKADLERRGHDVWFDREQIEHGDDWRRRITDGIEQSHRVLSFLSKYSTRDPGVCLDEIGIAVGVKGGNIQTILVESESEVKAPPTIGHLQWLDMHDWHERIERTCDDWGAWYQEKLGEIVRVVESEESRRFAGEIEQLKNWLAPITSASRIAALLQKGFVGRAWLHEAVERWRTEESTSRLLWIVGEPGVGKSAFAAHLTHFGRDRVAAAQFVEWDQPNHRNPHRVICNLAFQLATRLPEYRKLLLVLPEIRKLEGKTPEELFTYLLAEPLSHGIDGGHQRLLVVIDALDEATDSGNHRNPLVEMLARHAQRLPEWLGFVVTSRPESEVKAALQGLHPVELDTRTEANREDVRTYLRNQLAASLAARNDADALVARILEASEGVFQYVERFCEDVRLGNLSMDRPDEFPQGLGGIYLQWFLRQFPDLEDFRKRVRPVLRAVLAAREPLPLQLARQLFPLPEEDFHDLLRSLGSMFPVTGPPDARVIKSCHKSLSDWLQDETRSHDFCVSSTEGHRLLAEVGLREYARDVSAMSPYMLRHLPTHLCKVENWEALAGDEATPGVLTDLRYIQVKCTAGLTPDLVSDYNRALEVIPGGQDDSTPIAVRLRHFSNFVSHHLGVLSWYPEETHPIAVNYADSGPVVSQAERLLDEGKIPHLLRNPRPPLIPLRPACLRVLAGHTDDVHSVVVTPDGKRIVSGSNDSTLRVWDLETGECLRVLEGHTSGVNSVAVTPDGKRIVSGSNDRTLRVWDLETGKCLRVMNGHKDWVVSVVVTLDGKRIVSGSRDKAFRVWDLETGGCLRVMVVHEEMHVNSVVVTPDGKRIVSGSYDDTRVWDKETGECLRVMEGHKGWVFSVAVTPDGKRTVSGSGDKTIRVWDFETRLSIYKCYLSSEVQIVAISPNGDSIVAGTSDGQIHILTPVNFTLCETPMLTEL